ncbi:MAG: D-glycerate dehydrogenase [Phycisphaerales bacterium]|nr:D-glycerate dehydrogenase [Phycisphaerales bacterium]
MCTTRPLPGDFAVPGAAIRTGPERGFASREELLAFVPGATAIASWVTERIDAELLDAAGPQLKIVANFAVGYDNIDVPACRARNVIVTNTPDAVTEGTADMAWALLLAAARRVGEGDRFARSGAWASHGSLGPVEFLGVPVAGQTLCIIGAGRIGYATALRSLGWGMRITYVARSRHANFEHAPLNARHVSLEDGLRTADFVSIHTPLTPQTKHLIGAKELALMKPTAVLINTSRGPVIDEAALADALKERKIFGAGLDVFEHEPKVNDRLKQLDNIAMTPHIGSGDTRCRNQMAALCAANIRAVLAGDKPLTPVT